MIIFSKKRSPATAVCTTRPTVYDSLRTIEVQKQKEDISSPHFPSTALSAARLVESIDWIYPNRKRRSYRKRLFFFTFRSFQNGTKWPGTYVRIESTNESLLENVSSYCENSRHSLKVICFVALFLYGVIYTLWTLSGPNKRAGQVDYNVKQKKKNWPKYHPSNPQAH